MLRQQRLTPEDQVHMRPNHCLIFRRQSGMSLQACLFQNVVQGAQRDLY